MLKDGKSANRNEHPIPKTDLKKKKAENPNAPFNDESDSSVHKLHK